MIYKKYIKRVIDICAALVAILVFWWVYVIIAILVRFKLGSPVIFKQERVGKNEKFSCYINLEVCLMQKMKRQFIAR